MKRSAKAEILSILSRHPQGINAAKVSEILLKEYSVAPSWVPVLLSRASKEGLVRKTLQTKCGCCGKKLVLYKLVK